MGTLEEQAVWTEKCMGCGDCMLAQFGGICPVTRCAKRLLNGPCGGSTEDHCEVDPDRPCVWQLIYARLESIGQLDRLDEIVPPKDWSPSWHSGARKIVRKEHQGLATPGADRAPRGPTSCRWSPGSSGISSAASNSTPRSTAALVGTPGG